MEPITLPTAVTGLRCDNRTNPLGLDLPRPRLSWRLETARYGARQTAYQLRVTSGSGSGDTLWDSGRIPSDQTVLIPYDGPPLVAGQRADWTVRVWDETGATAESTEPAFWEAGPLAAADWRGAAWIETALVGGPTVGAPCPFLRRRFVVAPGKTVVSARLYATALGLYEAYLNGTRIGEDVFAPGWTDYSRRIQYQAYDVTGLLHSGSNTLGAVLGDGWFCGHVEWRGRQRYGDRPKFLACLVVRYGDGSEDVVTSGDSGGGWEWASGPILESDLLMGEAYDARRYLSGWCDPAPSGDSGGSDWHPAQATIWQKNGAMFTPGKLVGMRGPAVHATEELMPVAEPAVIGGWPQPVYVFDFGQNLVGRVRVRVTGPRGATVRLRFAETLAKGPNATDGGIYTANLRSARQTDTYTLSGDPNGEVYESRFTFHGFRYVEWSLIEGTSGFPAPPTRDALTAVVLHSDTPRTGDFVCSDPLLNQLQKNIDWGQRGNFVDIPTDCPQRDERLGWTGDAQVFIRTAACNRDVAGFFTKWQADIADAQGERGQIPPIVPDTGIVGGDGGPAWADAAIICPWTIYQCYGDQQILADHWDTMARFVGYLEETARDGIRVYEGYKDFGGFGDWLAVDGTGKLEGGTPKDLIGTAFFAHDADLMARIADVLGKPDEAARYRALFERVRQAFVARFVTPAGLVFPGTQTAFVLALHFGLLPPDLRPAATEGLVRDIERRGHHLSTGFVGSPYLPHVLSDNGRLDVAYRLLHQKTWPSWLYAVTQGATTIWERWDGWTTEKGFQDVGMNSFNHYAYGAIGAWLFRTVAGLDTDPEQPGFRHGVLRPRPQGSGLTSVSAYLDTPHGRLSSAWELPDGGGDFVWRVTVPPNTSATLHVPAGEHQTVREDSGILAAALTGRTADAAVFETGAGAFVFRVN